MKPDCPACHTGNCYHISDNRAQLEHTDKFMTAHSSQDCKAEFCTLHNRSKHHMRHMPQNWRTDRGMMERICEHGVGHPDPDEIRPDLMHGCDGCCIDWLDEPIPVDRPWKRVIIESPYAGDIEANVQYARECMHDSLMRGEAPLASHLLYTQPGILDDNIPEERAMGIEAGLIWGKEADATVVYVDLGITEGMIAGIGRASKEGRPVAIRYIRENK